MVSTALIDADMLAFSAASAVEAETDWGDDLWTLHSCPHDAMEIIGRKVEIIQRVTACDEVAMCFSCPSRRYFRHDIDESYKASRTKGRKPIAFARLKELVAEQYTVYVRPNLEADDVMGILATSKNAIKGRKVIVSGDKDMRQIPGEFCNLLDLDEGIEEISKQQADRLFYKQTLTGDVTDNYPGCPGVGDTGADTALDELLPWEQYEHMYKSGKRKGETETKWRKAKEKASPWAVVVSLYEKAGLCEDVAVHQARLARILRSSDYSFKNKEPRLWKPA